LKFKEEVFMRKFVFSILTIFLAFLAFSNIVSADTNDFYNLLDGDNVAILNELDSVTEFNEEGLPVVNLEQAYNVGLSDEAIEVALNLNAIVRDIETNGESSAIASMERALFPIGDYGNYCGKGNNGWNKQPIDDLDAACREHDKCFKGFTKDNRACNQAFLRRLAPIMQKNNVTSKKGGYASAAFYLFSKFV
ncbi:phospholipase A2 family protein, partial [Streptococcus pluranimalium]|uniref:phospholipase A2 family protein n=3 Tax=Bacteria TaxID=2 RepID=UPI002A7E3C30|nr:phospholipase A2 family protein [Streptococcus pluranimalium]